MHALAPPLQDLGAAGELQARKLASGAQVTRAMARFEAAQAELRRLESQLQRTEKLARQGFVAASLLESERLATMAERKERDAAAAERSIASFELEQAAAAMFAAGASGAAPSPRFALRAPISGRVLRVLRASEGVVALGSELLELGTLEQLEVVAELLTADALKAAPGSVVRIERWGGAPLQGRVPRIEPTAFTKISALGVEEQRVEVLIDIVSPDALWSTLGANFRVHVRIVTLALEQARKVPVGAVFPLPGSAVGSAPDAQPTMQTGSGARAEHAVYVIESGRARLTPIVLGARNEHDAWVPKGLRPGQRVIVYPPEQVRDGLRVGERSVEARR
jgi:HlyD family secretion protein